ncbi:MAG: hypothetical protein WAT23_15995 [Chromatiaceae bacterium]
MNKTPTSETPVDEQSPKLSKAETDFNILMDAEYQKASSADKAAAATIGSTGSGSRYITLASAVAAVIFHDKNKRNRDLTLSKVIGYRDAMQRGEWKRHHQGIAFYDDGTLADGQHRIAATALSGMPAIEFMVSSDFPKDAIDTIDRVKTRTAGESLLMMGVMDGKAKAALGKTAMEYVFEELNSKRPAFTDIQVERWVMEKDSLLAKALVIGRKSTENVSDPCLTQMEAATDAALMLLGGWGEQQTVSYIASIQQGVATYPESPTVILSRLFLRAKINARRTDRLTKKTKIALALKGAALWLEEKSVARMVWNPTKEALPSHIRPVDVAL